jgi:hypothetical protein
MAGYNVTTHEVAEWNVGCEKCHGPGSDHVKQPSRTNIVNPVGLDMVRANDVLHAVPHAGQPLQNPVEGRYYDWPVGYTAGGRLADYWKLEEHKLGETTLTHFADGAAHKNRMQGDASALCVTCHSPSTPNGPATDIAAHTRHAVNIAGADYGVPYAEGGAGDCECEHPVAYIQIHAARSDGAI